MKTELWVDTDPEEISERRRYTLRSPTRRNRLGIYTLNGHLVPFSGWRWDRIVLGIGERASPFAAFGASEITYLNTARDKGYTVRQSKGQFFSIGWEMARTLWRFIRGYPALKAAYRDGYGDMTSRDYWEKALAPDKALAAE